MLHDAARKGNVKLFRLILEMGAGPGGVGMMEGKKVEEFIEEEYKD